MLMFFNFNLYANEDRYVISEDVKKAYDKLMITMHNYFLKMQFRYFELLKKKDRTLQEEDEFTALSLIVNNASDKEINSYLEKREKLIEKEKNTNRY